MTTDELIDFHAAHSTIDRAVLEAVIPKAIDTLYAARDAGGTMHDAGAACAVAVLDAMGARTVHPT